MSVQEPQQKAATTTRSTLYMIDSQSTGYHNKKTKQTAVVLSFFNFFAYTFLKKDIVVFNINFQFAIMF